MTIGKKIAGGFGLTLAILIIIGYLSYRGTTQLAETGQFVIETNQMVAHTYEVLASLEELLSLMKDAETGQRGYLLTGDLSYLQPYTDAKEKVFQALGNVK